MSDVGLVALMGGLGLGGLVRRWKVPVAAVLATAMALLCSPSPATGDDGSQTVRLEVPKGWIPVSRIVFDGSGRPVSDYSVRIETTSTKQYSVLTVGISNAGYCELNASPAPTYSWSNHTMHWGAKAICNIAVPLRIRMSLWSGPDMTQWQDSTGWTYAVGFSHSQGKFRPCLDWGSFTYWRLLPYAEVNIDGYYQQFVPYPGVVPPRWQECIDIS